MKNKNQKKSTIPEASYEAIKAYNDIGISTDPLGSYTGNIRITNCISKK